MSQDDIIAWPRARPGWHFARELIDAGISENAAYTGCKLMRKNGKVEYKAGEHGIWLYRAKQYIGGMK